MKKIGIVFITVFFTLLLTACFNNGVEPKGEYNVLFIVDGEIYHTTKADEENPLILPADPVKDNFIFDGWLFDGNIISSNYIVTSNIILTAVFSIDSSGLVTIIFRIGSTVHSSISGAPGDIIEFPEDPTGNTSFIGWSDAFGYPFENLVFPDESIILFASFAKQILITFYVGGNIYESLFVESGGEINFPADPVGNFTFIGWFTSDNVLFEDIVAPNNHLNLYAQFDGNVTVSFYIEDELYDDYRGLPGETLYYPSNDPIKEGHYFDGWYTENNIKYTSFTLPEANLDLYARFSRKITVTFNIDNEEYYSFTGREGDSIDFPTNPVDPNLAFAGWFTSNDDRFTESTLPSEDIILYAKFVAPITITFYVDEVLYDTVDTIPNEWFAYPDDPTPVDNLYFSGWYTINDELFEEHTSEVSLILYAKFIEQPSHLRLIEFYQDETLLHSELVDVGSKFDPKIVAKEAGYNFKAWYTETELLNEFDINSNINDNIKLYGDWYDLTVEFGGYYSNLPYGLTGNTLRDAIHNIIDLPLNQLPNYGDARYSIATIDEDPNNTNNIIHIYTGTSTSSTWDNGGTWNREHVVPQSRLPHEASNSARNSASDIHNLKPLNPDVNSSRGNKGFADSFGAHKSLSTTTYYPGDDWIGDVARIILYMITQYPELNTSHTLPYLITSIDLALDWIQRDPVDEFEANRNNLIYTLGFQNNRNPYVDLPYLAYNIWV